MPDAAIAILILIAAPVVLSAVMLIVLWMMAREIGALDNDMEAIKRDMWELTHPAPIDHPCKTEEDDDA